MSRTISILIPVFNEEENIRPLVEKIGKVAKSSSLDYEIIFVDDGSRDATFKEICKISEKDSRIKYIRFYRNFGKSAALSSGFGVCKGDIIITMDGDLQDDPEEIMRFIKKIDEGFDLVVGWKKDRKDPLSKTLPSKFFNRLASRISGIRLHDFNCGFKAYRKIVVQHLNLHGELHRYIPSLANWKGFSITEIPVKHHERIHGKSKYGYKRLLRGMMDLITIKYLLSYSRRPLHLFGPIGGLMMAAGGLIGVWLAYINLAQGTTIVRPLLFLAVLLLIIGIQILSIGLFAELLAEVKGQEDVVIKESKL
jgi:glycosyltransferase involved in cell wall biosynthesis